MDLGPVRAVRDEWRVVKTAPWSFIVIAVVAVAAGFGIGTLWWSGTVSTLRERLAFAQDQLQTALAHPQNPAAALVTKTDEKGRRLVDSEKRCLIAKFKDATKDFVAIIITSFPNDEAQKYATDFTNLFIRMGYQSGVIQGSPKSYDDTGLIVGIKDPDHPSDAATKFKEFFGACVALHDRRLVWSPPPTLLPQYQAIDFNLFVGPVD